MAGDPLRIIGLPRLVARLRSIDAKVARKALRRAVLEATRPVLATARADVPVETKLLRKSLGRKVKTYQGGLVAVGVVGPRRGFAQAVVRPGRKAATVEDPANIAHLVEYGTDPHSVKKGAKAPRSIGSRRAQIRASARSIARRKASVRFAKRRLAATQGGRARTAAVKAVAARRRSLKAAKSRLAKLRRTVARSAGWAPSGGRVHPGAKAQPFLNSALAKNAEAVKAIMTRSLGDALARAKRGR